jgi:16S rRNA (guanine527-N7)-methyltransferase
MNKVVESTLAKGLAKLNLPTSDAQLAKLLSFITLLQKWNQHFNLTAVRDPLSMVTRHILDSLSVSQYLNGNSILDVGTGAGLPGIPLSIFSLEKQFFLLDSNQKKQVFVSQAVKSLSLVNVNCVHSQVETYQPVQKFSTILARAFAPMAKMIPLAAHLLAEDGLFLLMLGKIQQEEDLPLGFQIQRIVSLKVPGENAQRHLAIIVKGK